MESGPFSASRLFLLKHSRRRLEQQELNRGEVRRPWSNHQSGFAFLDRDGILGYNRRLRSGRHHCVPLRLDLLQQGPFHQSISPDIDNDSCGLLLDDVGNSIPGADEAIDRAYPKWRVGVHHTHHGPWLSSQEQ